MADGKTAYERTVGVHFDGPVIPFGATVSCNPSVPKLSSNFIMVVKRCRMDYSLGMSCWRKEGGKVTFLFVADCEDVENLCASEIHIKKFKHPEVSR